VLGYDEGHIHHQEPSLAGHVDLPPVSPFSLTEA
jgi:hypothetical protein